MIIIIFFIKHNLTKGLGQVKEKSQGDVSFTHPKHMLLETFIKIDHEWVIFSESNGSNRSSNFQGYVHCICIHMGESL